jgi:hypothetical protein
MGRDKQTHNDRMSQGVDVCVRRVLGRERQRSLDTKVHGELQREGISEREREGD